MVLLNTKDQKILKFKYYFIISLVKWKKGFKEFPASPTYDERHGCMIIIPKPIVKLLKTPEKFVFKITVNKVSVIAEGKNEKWA